jgi:glyoxylase I family protein
MLSGVHHIAIICSNYEVSKKFYTEILGLTIKCETYRQERDSYKLDLCLNGIYVIELFSFPNRPPRPSYPEACGLRHLAFSVNNIDEVKQQLESSGIKVENIRLDEITNKRFTFFEDPDQLPIEIYEADNYDKSFSKFLKSSGISAEKNSINPAYDYKKHYTSCLMGTRLSFGWPVYFVFDEVKSFDGDIEAGFYYIETDNFFPFKGAGWYDADLVYYAYECKLIKKKNILLQYKSSTVLDIDNFKTFIKEVYSLFDKPYLTSLKSYVANKTELVQEKFVANGEPLICVHVRLFIIF